MKHILLLILNCSFLIFNSSSAFADAYTWTGTTNKSWNTSTNWSPNGVPTTADTVTLGSGTDTINLSNNVNITNLIQSGRRLNLAGYSLTCNGTSAISGGVIYNGILLFSGTQVTFSSTADIQVKTTITASIPLFNGGTFADSVIVNTTFTASVLSAGGTTFNGPLKIDAKGGLFTFRIEGNTRNIYQSNANITATIGGRIIFEHGSRGTTGSTFNGTVSLTAKDTAYILHRGATGITTTYTKKLTVVNQDSAQVLFS